MVLLIVLPIKTLRRATLQEVHPGSCPQSNPPRAPQFGDRLVSDACGSFHFPQWIIEIIKCVFSKYPKFEFSAMFFLSNSSIFESKWKKKHRYVRPEAGAICVSVFSILSANQSKEDHDFTNGHLKNSTNCPKYWCGDYGSCWLLLTFLPRNMGQLQVQCFSELCTCIQAAWLSGVWHLKKRRPSIWALPLAKSAVPLQVPILGGRVA